MSKIFKVLVVSVIVTVTCASIFVAGGYKVHQCNYVAMCEDNGAENGYYVMTLDKDMEAYYFRVKNDRKDYSKSRYIVITRGDNKNIVFPSGQAHYINRHFK